MTDGDEKVAEILREYRRERDQHRRELRNLPEGYLYTQIHQGRIRYTQVTYENDKRIRKGITTDKGLIYNLGRRAYLEQSVALLSKSIAALERVLKTCKPHTPDVIIANLPEAYSSLPREVFFSQQSSRRKWMSEGYEKSTHRTKEKSHTACTGEMARSKSEALIIDLLEKHDIAYRYEQMLYIENKEFAPDFTILTREKIYYWEHCGMVSDENYVAQHNWKVSMYAKAGIVPWKNLIVTYDDEEGNFNSRIAEAEIINKLIK